MQFLLKKPKKAEYSHAGSADTWQVGLVWAPIEDLRIRGTISEAVRAPNVSETFGIVWTPSYVENLSLTVDYFNIEISDAINLVDAQDILDNCVDATGGPDSSFCDSIDRNVTTNDVELVRSGYINASGFNTKGIEANLRYNTDLSEYELPGELRFNLSATKLLALEIFEFQNRPDEINIEEGEVGEVGEVGDPALQWSTSVDYRLEDININWSTRYISSVVLYDVSPDGGSPEDVDTSKIDAIWTHDFSAVYYTKARY
jgi:outer membrane receptor protein involved in Fe transport